VINVGETGGWMTGPFTEALLDLSTTDVDIADLDV